MERASLFEDRGTEIRREIVRRAEIDGAPDQLFEFEDHRAEAEHAGSLAGLELHQHVDVALGGEVRAKDAAKERETSHAVARAERGYCPLWKVDAVQLHRQHCIDSDSRPEVRPDARLPFGMAHARPLVVITEDLDPAPERWLAERCEVVRCGVDEQGFGVLLARADALVVRTYTIVNEALLARAPRLRVVGRAGVGLDNVDLKACEARGVKVVNTPDANTRAVVEYVFALLADATRPRVFLDEAIDAKRWNAMRRELVGERELNEMVMGVYGLGRIGSGVARVAAAMEMETIYHDIREIPAGERHGARPVSRDELLRRADVLTVHVDGRPENRGLLDAGAFGLMRESVIFVNTSRGLVVDASALAAFMRGHERAMALIDVHEPEPFGAAYPLLGLKNVHLSAHLASGTRRAKENMSWVVRGVWEALESVTRKA